MKKMSIIKKESQLDHYKVAAFYSFTPLTEEVLINLQEQLIHKANHHKVMGTVLLASEGVNGTICGSMEGVGSLLEALQLALQGNLLDIKISWSEQQAFRRFKARRKAEIVTMGITEVNPNKFVGTYIDPQDWNDFLKDPETLVIDTRNKYEIGIGTFEGSLDPKTETFREFPAWVDQNLSSLVEQKKTKRIAMFCTGGIRCEKATSYLKSQGFKGVHHLRGGILRYLEEIPENENLWRGECFVFDQRVALNQSLLPGDHLLCHACGMPLNSQDREDKNYIPGVQCLHCKNTFNDQDRARFAERQKHYDHLAQLKLRRKSLGAKS